MKTKILPFCLGAFFLLSAGCQTTGSSTTVRSNPSSAMECPSAQCAPEPTFEELCLRESRQEVRGAKNALQQTERPPYLQREAEEIINIMEGLSARNCMSRIEMLGEKLFFEDQRLHLVYRQSMFARQDGLFTVRLEEKWTKVPKEKVTVYPARKIKSERVIPGKPSVPDRHVPEQWDAVGYGRDR